MFRIPGRVVNYENLPCLPEIVTKSEKRELVDHVMIELVDYIDICIEKPWRRPTLYLEPLPDEFCPFADTRYCVRIQKPAVGILDPP